MDCCSDLGSASSGTGSRHSNQKDINSQLQSEWFQSEGRMKDGSCAKYVEILLFGLICLCTLALPMLTRNFRSNVYRLKSQTVTLFIMSVKARLWACGRGNQSSLPSLCPRSLVLGILFATPNSTHPTWNFCGAHGVCCTTKLECR